MEYFHLGIFVIPKVYLIKKYDSQTQAFFFVFHRFFDTVRLLDIQFQSEILANLKKSGNFGGNSELK